MQEFDLLTDRPHKHHESQQNKLGKHCGCRGELRSFLEKRLVPKNRDEKNAFKVFITTFWPMMVSYIGTWTLRFEFEHRRMNHHSW